jgi:hypothetical protein
MHTVQYGDKFMRLRKVYNLVERFKGAETSVAGDACSERPPTVTYFEVREQIDKRIRDN